MNHHLQSYGSTAARERGVVLVITLILLLVLTLVGLAATTSTSLEEKMTANQRDMQVAFQAAEAALRDGENQVQNVNPGDFNNTGGMFSQSTSTITDFDTYATTSSSAWTDSNSVSYVTTLDPAPASQPRYFIVLTSATAQSSGQSLASDQPAVSNIVFDIYARGVGLSGNSVVILQSSYAR